MRVILVLIYINIAIPCFAQLDSLKKVSVKSAANQQSESYSKSNSADMVFVAETNGYPSPIKVLKQANYLKLNANQKSQLESITNALNRKSKEMDTFIIEQESKLNSLFASQKINEGSLIFYTNKIATLQAELRNAYLKAHYQTKKVLNSAQLKAYQELSINSK